MQFRKIEIEIRKLHSKDRQGLVKAKWNMGQGVADGTGATSGSASNEERYCSCKWEVRQRLGGGE